MLQKQHKSKSNYDRSAKRLKPLTTGEQIRIQQGNRWKPAVVTKQVNDRSYIVNTDDGGSYRRNRRHLLKTNESPSLPSNSYPDHTEQISVKGSGDLKQNLGKSPVKTLNKMETFSTPRLYSRQQQQEQVAKNGHAKEISNFSDQSSPYITRSGRQVIAPKRLDL